MKDEGKKKREDFEPDHDLFLRQMVRDLSGTLEEVVGLQEANGVLALNGQGIATNGQPIRNRMGDRPTTTNLGEALCDFKSRIQGDFHGIETTEDQHVLGNRSCAFWVHVEGRPSPCMMTSNIFGTVVADNFGHDRIVLERTIAMGDKACRAVVHLYRDNTPSAGSIREYFK
jgi:hypothetical protein